MLARVVSDRSQVRWRLSVSTALVAHLTAALALGSLGDPDPAAKATPEPTLVIVALDDSGTNALGSGGTAAAPGAPTIDAPAAQAPKGTAPAPKRTRQPAPRPRPQESRTVLAAARETPEVDAPRATAVDSRDAQPESLESSTAEAPDERVEGAFGLDRLATGGSGDNGAVVLGINGHGAPGANGAPGALGGGRSAKRAKLLLQSARCNDLFPHAAMADSGRVTLEIDVAPDGTARHARVLAATPAAEGFAPAAHHCVKRLRFSPARDAVGHAVASLARVRLGFRRN